jgi:hypothetical protein
MGGLALLRPHPHRGDLIAAGAVPFALAVGLLDLRMDETWGAGIHLVIVSLACGLVLGMGFLAEREPTHEHPRAYQTVLLLVGLSLLAEALIRLAEVLGADEPLASAGSLTWMSAAFAGAAAAAAWGRANSPIAALLALAGGGVCALAFVDWVFSPESATTFRWVLLALMVAFVAGHLRWRERKRRHAVHFVNAAGLAALALGGTFAAELVGVLLVTDAGDAIPSAGAGTWWELLLLAAGLGLIAYAAVDREPGPAWVSVAVLTLFSLLAGPPGADGASIVGWPLLLLLAGGAALAAGLRPLAPLPPSPDATREAAPTEPLPRGEPPE